MKQIFLIIHLTILSSTLFSQIKYPIEIDHIVDGDTFWGIDELGNTIKFRPIGFNCPEEANFGKPAQPFNEEATAFTTTFLKGKKVYVEYDVQRTDKWGRHLVYVYREDGLMLNEEILKSGWAEVATYPPNVKYVERFRAASKLARAQQNGMFGH